MPSRGRVQVNMHEAKTHLSRLVEAAERGEEIVIARGGTPVARLSGIDRVSLAQARAGSRGAWKGRVGGAEHLLEDDEETVGLFEGSEAGEL